MESLMLLVWKMRQDIRAQENRLLINTLVVCAQPERQDADKVLGEAWDLYRDTLFPYQREMSRTQDQVALDYLRKEVARGPVTVRPLSPLTTTPGARSRRRRSR
jgi:hypothetical protein